MLKSKTVFAALAFLAVAAFCFGTAFAEDEAPAAKPVEKKVEDTTVPSTVAVEVKTKTETPMCSIMSWIGEQVKANAGDDCKCCNKAMKMWFDGGAEVPLAGMRDRLVADGWTADSTIAFLKQMKAERDSGSSCGCAKGEALVKTGIAGDAAGKVAGDAAKGSGCDKAAGDCSGCDKAAGDCSGCEKKGDCGGKCPCDGAKKDAKPAKADAKP